MKKHKMPRMGHYLSATALGSILTISAMQTATAQEDEAQADDRRMNTVVVTAGRRAQDVTEIPYNITALGSDAIDQSGVQSIEDLSQQIPNLVVTNSGPQFLGAQRQIMRGLNASPAERRGVAFEQNPVSTYLGNAPYANFFQISDVERVEVLRGPQGTLYGAGALGGAIRIIPTEPVLGKFEGEVSGKIGMLEHSSDLDKGVNGLLNIPLGEKAAVRISGGYADTAGFIDQFGIWKREGGGPLGSPILEDPANPLTSPAVSYNEKDINSAESTDVRIALRWAPNDWFDATLSHNLSRSDGFGPYFATPAYDGGPDALIPSVVYPDTGDFEVVSRSTQPYYRDSDMTALDASVDLGFATVSSTTSRFTTDGKSIWEGTWGVLALPAAYLPYYMGIPANPRFNVNQRFDDENEVFTQEIRLVSNGEGRFDYILGAFYQKEDYTSTWYGFSPGQFEYNNLPGVSVISYPLESENTRFWTVGGTNKFTDKSIFGELTWHASDRLDLTFGARAFKQTLDREADNTVVHFGIYENVKNSSDASDVKFKFNSTYEYAEDHRAYFTFSQGFRRGGANAFSLSGFLREPEALLSYDPDSVDNFEVGLKGRFLNGWTYTADVFLAKWHDPQIGGFTAVNFWPVVFNGKEAESKGVEFEVSGNLTEKLSLSAGYSYTEAKLTEDFCVPSGAGTGDPADDIACAINGVDGAPLPSAPKSSGTVTLNYRTPVGSDFLTASLNGNYKGSSFQTLPTSGARYIKNPDYWLFNAYLGWEHGSYTTSVYARNLLDERVIYSTNTRITPYAPLDLYETIGRPRSVGVEIAYKW
ncbi:TonB-dependent receptor [Hyphomonas sp.]|uniref:TonB-dependent receptor n=1 Tax=Hyphomonas sp. TaxID=87 RepID=UPI0032424B56